MTAIETGFVMAKRLLGGGLFAIGPMTRAISFRTRDETGDAILKTLEKRTA